MPVPVTSSRPREPRHVLAGPPARASLRSAVALPRCARYRALVFDGLAGGGHTVHVHLGLQYGTLRLDGREVRAELRDAGARAADSAADQYTPREVGAPGRVKRIQVPGMSFSMPS